MKEVKYMEYSEFTDVPSLAKKLHDEKDVFRKNLIFLDQIAQAYNKVLTKSNGPERKLLQTKINQIDKIVQDGIEKIKWSDSSKFNTIHSYFKIIII